MGAGGAQSYTSKHGYPVTVDVQAEAVSAEEFDAVIVPGGYAPDMMRRHASRVDGNLITSRKPDDLPAFCREIIRALTKTA